MLSDQPAGQNLPDGNQTADLSLGRRVCYHTPFGTMCVPHRLYPIALKSTRATHCGRSRFSCGAKESRKIGSYLPPLVITAR